MKLYVTKVYDREVRSAGITDHELCELAKEIVQDPKKGSLGGGVYKKRVAKNQGKSGGSRVIIAYHFSDRMFFYSGWEKKDVPKKGKEIPPDLERKLKQFSEFFRSLTDVQLENEVKRGNFREVNGDD